MMNNEKKMQRATRNENADYNVSYNLNTILWNNHLFKTTNQLLPSSVCSVDNIIHYDFFVDNHNFAQNFNCTVFALSYTFIPITERKGEYKLRNRLFVPKLLIVNQINQSSSSFKLYLQEIWLRRFIRIVCSIKKDNHFFKSDTKINLLT